MNAHSTKNYEIIGNHALGYCVYVTLIAYHGRYRSQWRLREEPFLTRSEAEEAISVDANQR